MLPAILRLWCMTCIYLCISYRAGFAEVRLNCSTGIGSTKHLEPGEIPTQYSVTRIPGCNSSYFPKPPVFCGVPAGPDKFAHKIDGYEFTFSWRAINNEAGSFGVLQGFILQFFVAFENEEIDYSDCFYIGITPKDDIRDWPLGDFTETCVYEGIGTLEVSAILYSYPKPDLCGKTSDVIPRNGQTTFMLKRYNITYLPVNLPDYFGMTTISSSPKVAEINPAFSSSGEVAAGITAAAAVAVIGSISVFCWVKQRRKHGNQNINSDSPVIETVASFEIHGDHNDHTNNDSNNISIDTSKEWYHDANKTKPNNVEIPEKYRIQIQDINRS